MRDSFVLKTEIREMLADLDDEEKGRLFQAILDYESTDEMPEIEDRTVRIAFTPIRQTLDYYNDRWEKTREARSEAGKQGGRPQKANAFSEKQTKAKKANAFSEKQTKAKKAVSVSVGVSESVGEDVGVSVGEDMPPTEAIPPKAPRTQSALVEESALSPPVKEVLIDWLKYKRERNFKYQATSLSKLISEVGRHERESGASFVINAVNNSIANGWVGIKWDAIRETARSGTTFDANDYLMQRIREAEDDESRSNETGHGG